MGSYSRTAYLAIKAEISENIAVKPNVFVPLMSEDIVTDWGAVVATPVSGNRSMNLRALAKAIPSPQGTVNVLIEPKTIGYFLKAVFGALSTGRFMPITGANGDFTVGETVTGSLSAKTAIVVISSTERDYLLISTPSGEFTDGETLTGATSGKTAVLTKYDSTVYGHQGVLPYATLPTFTVEIGFDNEAYRYAGVRFNKFEPIAQNDNIITAAIGMTARSEFKHARITAITTSGAGAKTLTMDQTTGLAAADTIKLYRPGTGFLDFSATSVKTHTIGTVATELTITVTNLETATAVGDLIVLAPQTPSYTIDEEFTWIGGSVVRLDNTIDTTVDNSGASIEDFELSIVNELEPIHGANGVNVANRFPAAVYIKGLTGSGKISKTYTDMELLDRLRKNRETAIQVVHTGNVIGSTDFSYQLDWRIPNLQLSPFNPSLTEDDLLKQEIDFEMYYSGTDGFLAKVLLINDITTY